MPQDYIARCKKVAAAAAAKGIDLTLISPSSDMTYLCGYAHKPSDRPTLLVISEARDPFIVAPLLEAQKVRAKTQGLFEVMAWDETQDPFGLTRDTLRTRISSMAVAEQMWAGDLLRLKTHFEDAHVMSAQPLIAPLRMRKSEEELDLLRKAGCAADKAYDMLCQFKLSGMSEKEVQQELMHLLMQAGTPEAFCLVATGENTSSPHHEVSDRIVHERDAVWVDFGGKCEGYNADCTRTLHVGSPQSEYVRVYDIVRRAQETTVLSIRPGMTCQEVDRIARSIIQDAGYGASFIHRTGHGLGLDVHEHPYIVEGNHQVLEPGMVFSVEPGIYITGSFGVRIEDIVAVTNDGVEVLNNSTHDMLILH